MANEERLRIIKTFNWGSPEFIKFIGSLPEYKSNQFFKGLSLLIERSPGSVHDTELWQVALPGVREEYLDTRINKYFQDLRGLLKESGFYTIIQPYQLRDFHCSVALHSMHEGDSFMPPEREELIKTIINPKAKHIARVVYPVVVSGPLLRSHFDAKNFTILNFLLQNPNQPINFQFLLENKLIEPSTNIKNLKDTIDHKLRDLGLPARLSRESDTLGINLDG